MTFLVQDADMREHATFVQAGIGERGDPRPGRIPGGDLTALMKQDQVFFQPYAVFPATVLAPADQRGRAVEPVRRKQDGNALRNHGGHSIKQRLLLAKSDTALRLLDPPRDRNGPLADPFIGIIDRILEEDKDRPKKQRHTSKRIFERLRDEYGFTGKITIVKDYICGVRQRRREMFVPLTHPPGHAQVDFGEALAVIGGVERKIHFLAMSLPHSDACFVKAYPGETTEAFCDGHVSGFSFFGGVPRSILYDNTRIAVARILGDGKRQRTRVFSELRSHYLFEDRFGRPGKGNDKGKVEGIVGYCRRNFLAPMPRFRNFDDLNTHLEACCAKRWAEQLRGHDQTVGERLERDRAVLQRLPAIAYDACDKRPGRVSSLSLVRYRGTDYSVPTRFGHCEVLVRGYVHEVVISCAAEVIARHPRSYEQEDFVFDPLHYLSLLEQKTNALDQAAPLAGWLLPPVFGDLRRLLEARMGKAGKREYVQVPRLIESFSLDDVRAAISEALERGVIGFDAVKHLVLCRIEKRPPRLNLLAHPYLPRAEVATTSARSYMGLLKGAAP